MIQQLRLFASNLLSESVLKSWEKNPKKALKNIKRIRELNNTALLEMRTLLYELRPEKLSQENLKDLIYRLGQIISVKNNIKVDIKSSGNNDYTDNIKLQLYRIAQETMNNILKHSKATYVKILIESYPQYLKLVISDNGIGFNIDNKSFKKNFGLEIMKERARSIKASLKIISSPGNGTIISLSRKN